MSRTWRFLFGRVRRGAIQDLRISRPKERGTK